MKSCPLNDCTSLQLPLCAVSIERISLIENTLLGNESKCLRTSGPAILMRVIAILDQIWFFLILQCKYIYTSTGAFPEGSPFRVVKCIYTFDDMRFRIMVTHVSIKYYYT